jgi:hypothetical protein
MEETVFDNVSNPDQLKSDETLFDGVSTTGAPQTTTALPTTSLMLALANVDTSKNPTLQLTEDAIQTARDTIEMGNEMAERDKIAANRAIRQGAALNRLKIEGADILTPEQSAQIDESYRNVLTWKRKEDTKTALEQEAIDKIKEIAARDPIQAKVLLDNLQFGGAEQTHSDFLIKSSILAQRAEELDDEYKQSGWGRWALNQVFSLIPTNYNFARSGIISESDTGVLDWLLAGEGLRKQSETMWNMDVNSFAEFAAKDGPLMQSLRNNATTLGVYDPGLSKELLGNVTQIDDSSRQWANTWGSVEAASVLPLGKIAGITTTLTRAGARKEAQALLRSAAETMEREGAEQVVKKTGITPEELALNETTSHIDPTINGEASVTHAMDLATREEAARKALESLPGVVRERRLTKPEEIMAAYEDAEERVANLIGRDIKDIKFSRATEELSTGNELRSVEYIFGKKNGGGYAQKQTAKNAAESSGLSGEVFRAEDGQWYVKGKVNVAENGFFTNPLHEPTQGFLSRMTGRWWRSSSRLTDPELHGKAVSAGAAIGRQQRILGNMVNESYRSIPAKSQEVVQQVALLGANNKKWYSPDEFKSLVNRAYGREATEGELRVYNDLRLFNDMDWVLRNDQIFLDKVTRGMESVKFHARGLDFDMDAIVKYQPKIKPTDRIFNATDGVHYTAQNNPLTDAKFTELVEKGYVLVEPEEAIKLLDGTTVKKVLIRRDELDISPLRRTQLAYSEGGHRLYTDQYFIKQANVGKQPDTGTEFLMSPRTFRSASNVAEARKWADKMNEARLAVKEKGVTAQDLDDDIFQGNKAFPSGEEFLEAVNKGDISLNDEFEALFDKELPSRYKSSGFDAENFVNVDEVGFNGYYRTTGKMYSGYKGEVLRDTSGEIATTVDPYEALSTSLRQVTRNSGLFNYKAESIERFLRTYGPDLDIPDHLRSPYSKFDGATVKQGVSLERKNAIESHRFSIRNVLGFETPAEKVSQQLWRGVAEAVIGTGDNLARKTAHDAVWWFKERNPVAALRGFAFDIKLGMFNIGQLFIQASTMLSATALSPTMGLKGMMTAVPLHSYLLAKGSEQTLDVLAKRGVGKLAGFATEQEFKDYARYMHKTGFLDMNGSHVMIGENGPAAHFGTFGEKAEKFRETGRVFFYTAETYNRLVAFRIAWDETIAKGLKPGQEGFNASLLKLADDYSLNMTHESAAYWQKGVLSLPTQFWSYNVRMMDALLGSRFTAKQKARLLFVNMAMAGTAGVPGIEAISEYIKNTNGESPSIETWQGTLDRGFFDRAAYELTGADVRIGEKLGTGGWPREVVQTLFGTSEYGAKSFTEVVGGATYSITKRGLGILGDVAKYAFAESGGDMGSEELFGDSVLKMFQEISTVGNASKALYAAQYQAYKSSNDTLYKNIPESSAVYIALGFKPQQIDTLSHRQAFLQDRKKTISDAATQITKWRQEAFLAPDKYEENMKKVNFFVKMLPPDVRQEALKKANNRDANETLYDFVEKKYNEESAKQDMYGDVEDNQN